jgi:hypothetical protein
MYDMLRKAERNLCPCGGFAPRGARLPFFCFFLEIIMNRSLHALDMKKTLAVQAAALIAQDRQDTGQQSSFAQLGPQVF